ncbi:MAG TPA: acetyl-CoA hydrolase/transferase C-terminal domain-containing protein [Amycolatopsis sp.]|nr:acetyl-CoA hydrolase/transferase C-terminal domain-containing protein [Amycolatopsis sp.]
MKLPLVAYADGPGTLGYRPDQAAELLSSTGVTPLLGWVLQDVPWLADLRAGGAVATMGGQVLAPLIARGAVSYLPVRVASMPRLIQGPLRPDLLVVRGRSRGSGFTFGPAIGWAEIAARFAGSVVVLVDDECPDLGGPPITGNVVSAVEAASLDFDLSERPATADERLIAQQVAALVPKGATIQYGPGSIGSAVLAALDEPVGVWSGMATDSLIGLAERGLLNGAARVSYLFGGHRLTELAATGDVRVVPLQDIHDMGRLTRVENFVAVNTALEVGLDGSVNVERIGDRVVAGIGGHADFCAAASYNPTGLSVVALASERRGRSTIVPRVPVVSTARTDIHLVVTEHGTADLRTADDEERARRLIAIAAPHHREPLERAARALFGQHSS